MYFVVTTHDFPQFYRVDGAVIDVELKYTHEKKSTYIQDLKVITNVINCTNGLTSDGVWMVENESEAKDELDSLNVFPFKTKAQAKQFALHYKIKNYRYLNV